MTNTSPISNTWNTGSMSRKAATEWAQQDRWGGPLNKGLQEGTQGLGQQKLQKLATAGSDHAKMASPLTVAQAKGW